MRFPLLLLLLLALPTLLLSQEICDNAIDDDGDGLVDLNDPECICEAFVPSSLIPNPSFEEQTCCPSANAMLNCAVSWVQASGPTTDYVHTCNNYLGNTSIPAFAPLPFPDGEGGVGFRDGEDIVNSNYKEYVGACLTEIMEIGQEYRFDFYVGFQDNVPGSMNVDLAIFGSTDCGNLPFDNSFSPGCPTNTGNYTELGDVSVSG
ncbi:MAG: gliding motility-associated C-terminal domain-containing protein, partial [Bacteroidota bacterium]